MSQTHTIKLFSLWNMYKTLIRFKIDYGSIIFGSAKNTTLKILEAHTNANSHLITKGVLLITHNVY